MVDAGIVVLVDSVEPEFSDEAMQAKRAEVQRMFEDFEAAKESMEPTCDKGKGRSSEVVKFSGRNVTPKTVAGIFNFRSKHASLAAHDDDNLEHDITTLTKALDAHLAKSPSSSKVFT